MARPLRVNQAGGWYHVMNRGIERREIFLGDRDRSHFVELIGLLLERYGIEVHAYCLMDNHYHLAVCTPLGNLSEGMKWLGQSYSTWFNRKHQRVGPLFQGRFKSLPVDAEDWLWQLTFYIHLNPVRTETFGLGKRRNKDEGMGLVAPPTPEEVSVRLKALRTYRWSSFRCYAGYGSAPDWLQTSKVLDAAGKSHRDRHLRYREMTKDQVRRGIQETTFEQFKEQIAVGSAEFLEKIKSYVDPNNAREYEGRFRFKRIVPLEKVIEVLEEHKAEPMRDWVGRHGDLGKWMLLWLAHRYCGLTQAELGEKVGDMDYSSVSAGIRRFNKKIQTERRLKKQMDAICQMLNVET